MMKTSPELSVIIVNWNSAEYVRRCLHSINQQTRALDFEIIVIDNASYDGCELMLAKEVPEAIYIQSEKNLGFANANNKAAERAQGSVLLFLNPDTEVQGSAIKSLLDSLRRLPNAGAVGPKLLNADGSVQTSCIQSFPSILNQVLDSECLRRLSPKSRLWGMAPLFRACTEPAAVEVICGACLMIERETFNRVGRFTSNYFMYGEDADLCHKVQSLGLTNYFIPDANVLHLGGGSSRQAVSSFSAVMLKEAIWQFFVNTKKPWYAGCYRLAMMIAACLRLSALGIRLVVQPFCQGTSDANSLRKWREILLWSAHRETRLRRCGVRWRHELGSYEGAEA